MQQAASRLLGSTGRNRPCTASIDWRQQDCSKNAAAGATVDVEAVFKNDLGIPQYPPLVLRQLDVLPFYELIIKSPAVAQQLAQLALQQYGVSWFLDLVRRDLDLGLVNLRFVVETSICEYWYVYTTNGDVPKKT